MSHQQWTDVDAYLSEILVPHDAALEAALADSAAAGLPDINVTPNQGKLLHLLARIAGARRILEIGTLGGYSTIWLARALGEGGLLTTLELNPDYARVARGNLERAGVSHLVTVRVGDAVESLRQLAAEDAPPFDFVFIDANKDAYPQHLEGVLKLSRPGTVIVGDNVVRNGRVADERNGDPDVLGVRRYFKRTAADPRLTGTAIQTVGSKGWDGFSVTLVEQ